MRRVGICLAIAAAGPAMPLLAQKNAGLPAPAAAPPTPAVETMGLGEATNRMTVPVEVAGQGPYPFIIDTGAERSVVSRELALKLGLDPGGRARLFDFVGASTVDTVLVPSLSSGSLGTLSLDAPALAAANLGAPGMLGIDALQGRKVVIDFDRKRMTIVPAPRRAKGDVVVAAAEARAGQLIVTKATFEGHPIAVIVDTGSWVNVGNSAMLALARRRPRAIGPITIWSVTGKSFDTPYVAVGDLKIGDVKFDNFGMSFADVAPFARFGLADKPALILGMSALKLFRRVEIDFANRQIGFTLPRPPIDFHDLCRGGMSPCRSF